MPDTLQLELIKDSAFFNLTKSYNYHLAIEHCDKGIELSKEKENENYLGKFYSYKGLAYLRLENYSNAEEFLKTALQINTTIDNKKEVSVCLGNLGKVYFNQGLYDEALNYYNRNIDICFEIDRIKGTILSYNNIGLIYMNRGNYTSAIKYYQDALDLATKNNLKTNMSHAMENLGTVYGKTGNYELSLKYYKDANQLKYENNDKPGIVNSLINIGYAYSKLDNIDLALQTYTDALIAADKYGTKHQLSVIYSNISAILLRKEMYSESLNNSLKAYRLNKEKKRYPGLVSSGINIAEAYMKMGNYKLAEIYILEALEVATKNDIVLSYSSIYESLSDLYVAKGDYKQAYYHTMTSLAYRDSLMNLDLASEIEELNIKYETSQKEKQIAIQELTIINQNEDIAHKNQITKIIIIVLIIIITFIVILLALYVQKRKAYKILVQQNIALANSEIKVIFPQKNITEDIKYSGSKLREDQKDEILEKLNTLMQEDEIFLNKQLCIEDVAEMLETNRKYLSQLINESFSMNFNNYINEYRVHKARKLLINSEHNNYTIEAIANEAGFHSKATFNTSFKKFAGVTPSFFKNNQ